MLGFSPLAAAPLGDDGVARDVASDTGAEIVEVPMPNLAGYQRYTCADMTKTSSYL